MSKEKAVSSLYVLAVAAAHLGIGVLAGMFHKQQVDLALDSFLMQGIDFLHALRNLT